MTSVQQSWTPRAWVPALHKILDMHRLPKKKIRLSYCQQGFLYKLVLKSFLAILWHMVKIQKLLGQTISTPLQHIVQVQLSSPGLPVEASGKVWTLYQCFLLLCMM